VTLPPYVGISGYATPEQARAVHGRVSGLLGTRKLADGYLIWLPFLRDRWVGAAPTPPAYASRALGPEAARAAFAGPGHGSWRIAHFGTSTHSALDEQLHDCAELLGDGVDGFQINAVPAPRPTELADFRRGWDRDRARRGKAGMLMILQLHRSIVRSSPADLVRYVAEYVTHDALTHVLYDPSEGTGSAFRPDRAIAAVRELKREFPQLHYGAAGGLSPENLAALVEPLWSVDPTVSIDAEGRLRDPATDALVVPRAVAYARSATRLSDAIARRESSR
jgi:hypothetical protein